MTSSPKRLPNISMEPARPSINFGDANAEDDALALPLEVIERILKLAFLPSSPIIPSWDPSSLRGTSHILLVSRGIHELALPFLYHTLVLTKPSHYITFFGSEGGLFVGSEGERRWKHVREIAITHDLTPLPDASTPPSTWLGAVAFQSLKYPSTTSRIDRLCLLDRLGQPSPSTDADALIACAQTDLGARHRQARRSKSMDVATGICCSITIAFYRAAKQFIGQPKLLDSCRPKELHLSTEIGWPRSSRAFSAMIDARRVSPPCSSRANQVVLHLASTRGVSDLQSLVDEIILSRRAEPRMESLQLVGFPADVLEEFRRWKEKGFHTPPGPAHAPGTDRAMFDRDQSWSWELPDGTLFTMHTQRKAIAA